MTKLSRGQLLLAATLLMGSTRALAEGQDEAPDGTTDETSLIRKGLDLREKGQDEAALEVFQHAFDLSKSGRALAQIALAEQALGRWLDAETHLSQALMRSTDAWIERNEKLLSQALSEIQGHLGSLELSGDCKAGAVMVNGVQVASLPLSVPLRVPAGGVALEVRAPGYLPILRTVVVPARGLAREPLVCVALAQPVPSAPPPSPPASPPSPPAPPPWSSAPPPPPATSATAGTEQGKAPARQKTWAPRPTAATILAVGALAALATGITFHVIRETRAGSYKDHHCETGTPPSDCQARYDAVNFAEYLAIAGYGGAAVLGGLATYLLLSSHYRTDASKLAATEKGLHLQCGPTVGLGILCGGQF